MPEKFGEEIFKKVTPEETPEEEGKIGEQIGEQPEEEKEEKEKGEAKEMGVEEYYRELIGPTVDKGVSEKMLSSVKDYAGISDDIIKKAKEKKEELEKEQVIEDQLKAIRQEIEQEKSSKRKEELIEKYYNTKVDYLIKQGEIEQHKSLAESFKYLGAGRIEDMNSVIKYQQKHGTYDPEKILKDIRLERLLAKVSGKYWRLIYKKYGTNIYFDVERVMRSAPSARGIK